MSMQPESESVQEHGNGDAEAPQERATVKARGAGRMRSHRLFAILSVVGFACHLAANLLVDIVFWLPEYIWFGSLVFSVLAMYTGASAACRIDGAARGRAIASAVIGALVLLGLMYSGVSWLFMMGEAPGPAVGASYQAAVAAGLLFGSLSPCPSNRRSKNADASRKPTATRQLRKWPPSRTPSRPTGGYSCMRGGTVVKRVLNRVPHPESVIGLGEPRRERSGSLRPRVP